MRDRVNQRAAVVEALQRLADALDDMREEVPAQLELVATTALAAPQAVSSVLDAVLEPVERQLRWLADDMARVRGQLTAKERGHD